MSMDSLKPSGYEPTRETVRDLSLVERLVIFALLAANGTILWHIPGSFGLVLGGGMFLLVGLMVLGELWRQVEIHVLGVPAKAGDGGESE